MKYVMIGNILPILFTEAMNHSDFKCNGDITSAGMCSIDSRLKYDKDAGKYFVEKIVHCYGESISLNLKPAEKDAERIKQFLLKWED
jgi:hypothetical protein